jgi:hypothetical protein
MVDDPQIFMSYFIQGSSWTNPVNFQLKHLTFEGVVFFKY